MNLVTTSAMRASPFASVRATRRTATRRDVVLPCQAVRERDFRLVADRTLDVSADGLLLPVRESLAAGETLIVSLPIPGMWIDAEATVTRVVQGRRPSDDGLAIGVLFHAIAPSSRAALAAYLHGKPPPLPRRGPLARMRRGEAAPALADELVMQQIITLPAVVVAEDDVQDVLEPAGAPRLDDDAFDALGVLTEVAAAWRRLVAND